MYPDEYCSSRWICDDQTCLFLTERQRNSKVDFLLLHEEKRIKLYGYELFYIGTLHCFFGPNQKIHDCTRCGNRLCYSWKLNFDTKNTHNLDYPRHIEAIIINYDLFLIDNRLSVFHN